jgi:hypothetical protein
MKNIIQYRFFDNNEEFVRWQEEQSIQLHSISPVVNRADSTSYPNDTVETLYANRIFVTFTYVEKEV